MTRSFAEIVMAFELRSNEIAFVRRSTFRSFRWSYQRVATTAYQVARELEANGISRGDRVLLCGGNSPEWIAIFFGLVLRGTIVVPIDVSSHPTFVAKVIEEAGVRLAICDAALAANFPPDVMVVKTGEFLRRAVRQASTRYLATAQLDDIAEVIFTSGTTTEPKGVCLSHRNLLTNLNLIEKEIRSFAPMQRLIKPVRFLSLVPLSHVFGQLMGMLVPQLMGGQVFFQDSLSSAEVIETVKDERISIMIAVPRLLQLLRQNIEQTLERGGQRDRFQTKFEATRSSHFLIRWLKFRDVHRLFGLRFLAFISGGATLEPDLEDFWRRLGFAVIQGYGMTETGGLIAINNPLRMTNRSVGKVLLPDSFKLSANGEILVRGDNLSPGYWNDSQRARNESDDWFHTGDVAEVDAEGNLYFKGRSKEIIVTPAGLNVFPNDLENVLKQQPEIKDAVVIGYQSSQGLTPLAALILRNQSVAPEHLLERVNKLLAPHQRLTRWFVWPDEDFPRTHTQKPLRREVSQKVHAALASKASMRQGGGGPKSLTALIAAISNVEPSRINENTRLGIDLELDSLSRVELISSIEGMFDTYIDEATFHETTTVGEIAQSIKSTPEIKKGYPYPRWQQRRPVSWIRSLLLYTITIPLVGLLGRPSLKGLEHLNELDTNVLFVCNHVTMVDHALILFALPHRFRVRLAIAQDGEMLRKWRHPDPEIGVLRRLVNKSIYFLTVLFFNVFSLPQLSGFRQSFSFAGRMIERGYDLLIFPEGERTKDGEIHLFRPGTGLLIKELDIAVVPIRIHGLWGLKERAKHYASTGEISIVFGPPTHYSTEQSPKAIARDLLERVQAL